MYIFLYTFSIDDLAEYIKRLKKHRRFAHSGIHMIIASFSIAPLGTGTSVSNYVKIARETLKKEHVSFQTNPMATVIETADLATLFSVIQKAHQAVVDAGAMRIITEIKIDDRRDKESTMVSKLKSL
jgi:uncharacterized protein (TIGR00106 family)